MAKEKRFFVKESDIKRNKAQLSSEETHHLKNVLRLEKGDTVYIFNGAGVEYEGTIEALSRRAEIKISKVRRTRILSQVSLTLAQAMPKKKAMDFIIQKACELGVDEIFALDTEYTAFKLNKLQAEKVKDRWEKIAVAACKQSRLDWIPVIHPPMSLKNFFDGRDSKIFTLMPHPDPGLDPLSAVMKQFQEPGFKEDETTPITILIGPEGGFSDQEVSLAKASGVIPAYMGDLILRADTAAVVSIALLKYGLHL